jgi:hypothetical protein
MGRSGFEGELLFRGTGSFSDFITVHADFDNLLVTEGW